MKLLETTDKPAKMSITSNALRAVIANTSSLLTWTKMLFTAGYVIIAVGTLGVLLGALVRLSNYRNGTQYQTGPILKDSLTYLWNKAREETRQKLNYQKNSQASAPTKHPQPDSMPSNILKKEESQNQIS